MPAILILNGSGPLDRDSNFAGQTLDVAPAFATHFAGVGIASLRFDKRGVGRSGGDFATTGLDLEIRDAVACFAALRSCDAIDGDRVGVIGHSIGAMIAMRLAAGVERVAEPPTDSRPGGVPADWMRDFSTHDPAQDLCTIECPVLAVTGRKDLQVDAEDVARMASMVRGQFA